MPGVLSLVALALLATLVWWGATGVLLLLTAQHERTYARSFAAVTVLALIGLSAIVASREQDTVEGAVIAFLAAIAIWAAVEVAFLMGFVVGPNRAPCPPAASVWRRFTGAVGALASHEAALLAAMLLLLLILHDAPNKLALQVFALLWIMRLSTKLNIFLGVANTNSELLPARIAHLKSYFGRAPINGFFPFSVTAASVITVLLAWGALTAANGHEAAGQALLAAFAALAVLEHWTLVLPLPSQALWPWCATAETLPHGLETDAALAPNSDAERGIRPKSPPGLPLPAGPGGT